MSTRLALLALSLLASCVSAFPSPTASDLERARVEWSDVTLEELAKGRELYVGKCGACHRLKEPGELAPDAWPAAVHEMADEANLGAGEREAIVRYLVTMSGS
jgi:nitrate/TMAO reductase-like tetraheme cytochrome c subunit